MIRKNKTRLKRAIKTKNNKIVKKNNKNSQFLKLIKN